MRRQASVTAPRPLRSAVALPAAGALTGALVAWWIWAPGEEATTAAPVRQVAGMHQAAPGPVPVATPRAAQAPPVPVTLRSADATPQPQRAIRVLSVVPGSEGPRVSFVAADGTQLLSAAEGEEVAGYRVLQIEDGAVVIAHGQELERVEVETRAAGAPRP